MLPLIATILLLSPCPQMSSSMVLSDNDIYDLDDVADDPQFLKNVLELAKRPRFLTRLGKRSRTFQARLGKRAMHWKPRYL
ncbi:unnamed protein product [Dibothriocephalus latus]|uniref:Uncharacterized protein n=1 Tax=Dibothriocephalus latus TaxID=60516 RepID=A0A3P6U707_DIBLA|nr:unnamed protein product [Dibothriocephalus latus]